MAHGFKQIFFVKNQKYKQFRVLTALLLGFAPKTLKNINIPLVNWPVILRLQDYFEIIASAHLGRVRDLSNNRSGSLWVKINILWNNQKSKQVWGLTPLPLRFTWKPQKLDILLVNPRVKFGVFQHSKELRSFQWGMGTLIFFDSREKTTEKKFPQFKSTITLWEPHYIPRSKKLDYRPHLAPKTSISIKSKKN